jgi:hypothetical protein
MSMRWEYVSELQPPRGLLFFHRWHMSMENHGGTISTGENSWFIHQSSLSLLPAESCGSKQCHSELVDINRHMLGRIINCIKFRGMHELLLRGHNASETSCNCGTFLDVMSELATLDSILHEHVWELSSWCPQYKAGVVRTWPQCLLCY